MRRLSEFRPRTPSGPVGGQRRHEGVRPLKPELGLGDWHRVDGSHAGSGDGDGDAAGRVYLAPPKDRGSQQCKQGEHTISFESYLLLRYRGDC